MTNIIHSFDQYKITWQESLKNPDNFWANQATQYQWKKKWNSVQTGSFATTDIKWFEGGELNITENCLDRHLAVNGNKVALIFEPNQPLNLKMTMTYNELHKEVCKMANVFKILGIKKGDRICFYMAMTPELMIGVLACARIGAVHSVVFGGFSAHALKERINDCKARLIVTHDGSFRGDKLIPLKQIVDEALLSTPSIEKVIVAKRSMTEINMKSGRDYFWHELINGVSDYCQAEQMKSEDPLFILYTSGSTGKPKGLMHTIAGYMVYVGYTFKNVFQVGNDDIFWCTADIGWVTGHSYLTYAPLLNGSTTLMFEGIPTYPNPGRFWQVIEKYKVTHFYTAPTAIRSLMGMDQSMIEKSNLSSLKVLGTVGEPINEEAWEWYFEKIGKKNCPIVDTWWQTETGGILISSLAGVTPSIPSFATLPMPGIEPVLLDEKGQEIQENEASGRLCIKKPWPGLARTIYGDHSKYFETYFKSYEGYYFTGDGALRDKNGMYRITGRIDDVLNVSGHRLGTAEIEDAINQHPEIIESAVVGFPHEVKGEGIFAYVICQTDSKDESKLKKEINEVVVKYIGPIAKPDRIIVVEGLPKTRSGKIMRRILRKIAHGEIENLGDTSTLLDPLVVEKIKKKVLG